MTPTLLLFALVKIAVVLFFLLNMAAIATWADRRQSAMVQDRIGPNRAVVFLPSALARALVLLPGLALGGLAAAWPFFASATRAVHDRERMTVSVQLAVFVGWVAALLLCAVARRRGAENALERRLSEVDPRSVFYVGLLLHAAAFAVLSWAVPPDALRAGSVAGASLLALLLLACALYAASRVPDGKVPLRLAGTLHAAADAVKLIFKEDFVPRHADRLLHAVAPMIALFPALVTFAVIPFGDMLCVTRPNGDLDLSQLGHTVPRHGKCFETGVPLQIADLNVGILYIFAIAGTGIIGAAVAGWASDNKFSLLGGLRAASQMVSYEVAMGLSVVGALMVYGSVRLGPMVDWQGENAWGIFVQPVGFLLFLVALAAETKRIPFDQPEGESEIVAGYFTEYSGMKFGMFFMGEYIELVTSSAILVTLFFGGYHLPFLHRDGITVALGELTLYSFKMSHLAVVAIGVVAFFGKTILVCWLQVFFRWTVPRFRYDQVMKLGWTKLLPLALANIFVTGVAVLAVEAAGPGVRAALRLLADATQGLLALAGLGAVVWLVGGLLQPAEHRRLAVSTSARRAAEAGGIETGPQQA